MKHIITLTLTLCLLLSLLAIGASAEQPIPYVFVTVALKGELVAAQVYVQLQDHDNDGAMTVNDALYGVHQQMYEGGAEAGYGYYAGEYGLSMSKLWGDESGAYGYYLNNASCTSLADPVNQGDQITAFVYTSSDWSDVYTYFDVSAQTVEAGQEITLTLMAAGYDENWNSITYPVEGATITVDGVTTGILTNQDGKATFKQNEIGIAVISAKSKTKTLVPPVCSITTVKAEIPEEEKGCGAIVGAGLIALLPLAYLCIKRNEN